MRQNQGPIPWESVALPHHCREQARQAKEELGTESTQKMLAILNRENPQLRPPRGQRPEGVPLQKRPDLLKCPWTLGRPGTYMKVLTNFKIPIFRETYPEDVKNGRIGQNVPWDSIRITAHILLQTGGWSAHLYMRRPTVRSIVFF
jgi:hypothetical protein